eukprot:6190139-Pleurochrysis_carterae.AAC.1
MSYRSLGDRCRKVPVHYNQAHLGEGMRGYQHMFFKTKYISCRWVVFGFVLVTVNTYLPTGWQKNYSRAHATDSNGEALSTHPHVQQGHAHSVEQANASNLQGKGGRSALS